MEREKTMEKYEDLEIEVVVFDAEDVIITSGGDDVGEWGGS